MYQVGTQAGNANTERQGTGWATVPDSQLLDNALLNQQQELMRQRKEELDRIKATNAAMTNYDPENWYVHDADIQGKLGEWMTKGGSLMAKGINPSDSTDPKSIAFQMEKKRIKGLADASLQKRDEFTKLQTVYNSPGGRDTIENWDEITKHYSNPSIEAMMKEQAPTVRFKQPLTDVYGTDVKILEGWNKASGQTVMDYKNAYDTADAALNNPIFTEGAGGGWAGMKKQTYNSFSEEERKAMDNRGRKYGVSGLAYFVGENLRTMQGGTIDFAAKAAQIGRNAPLSSDKREYGDVTIDKDIYKGGDKALKSELRSMLLTGIGQMERDVESGLYGNQDNSPEENIEAGVDYYLEKSVRPNIKSNYSRTVDEGRQNTDKEVETMSDKWYATITDGTQAQKEEAIRYLDKKEIAKFIPNMSDKEAIDVVFPEGDGFMVSVINTETPSKERKVWVPATTMSKEAMKNSYKNTYNDVKRHFATTESGSQQPASNQPVAPSGKIKIILPNQK